jgi:hypothetical protein
VGIEASGKHGNEIGVTGYLEEVRAEQNPTTHQDS